MLERLYKTVETDFASYYGQINSDDESTFSASLEPNGAKLELTVDFYRLGQHSPAAYHSEGHQDGMGVCLYLALVKQILGDGFRLAVRDDVVMSVDQAHRRAFCKLLTDNFGDVQFVITTHDPIWARNLQSSGLVDRSSQAHLYGWTVDDGPTSEVGVDVWERIALDLAKDDVPGAAHKLRRHLEATMGDIADSIGGRVPYHADGAYELGEFLSAVKGRYAALLKKAATSAKAWENELTQGRVRALQEDRARVIPDQEGENWAINKFVHNNDAATMWRTDFEPVVEASRSLLALFSCTSCGGTIYVVGMTGDEESLRCKCGVYNLNLRAK